MCQGQTNFNVIVLLSCQGLSVQGKCPSMKEETITLNTQEQKRAMVLNRIQAGQLSVAQAAGVLDLSARHVRRILAAYQKEGPAALAHGNRGRKPAHRISETVT